MIANTSSTLPSVDAAIRQFGTTVPGNAPAKSSQPSKTREVFDSFVGQAFYGQMLKALRSSQGKPPYFHGGRAEEVFQKQLDQILAESMSKTSAKSFSGSMFEQFERLLDLRNKE